MGKTYIEMYEEAAREVNRRRGNYAGYTGANALSYYVDKKYHVNAVAETYAMECLHDALPLLDNEE